jgi:hypothetical protein
MGSIEAIGREYSLALCSSRQLLGERDGRLLHHHELYAQKISGRNPLPGLSHMHGASWYMHHKYCRRSVGLGIGLAKEEADFGKEEDRAADSNAPAGDGYALNKLVSGA